MRGTALALGSLVACSGPTVDLLSPDLPIAYVNAEGAFAAQTPIPGFEAWLGDGRILYRGAAGELHVFARPASDVIDDRVLTPDLPAHAELLAVTPSPDGERVAYYADVESDGAYRVFVVEAAATAVPRAISSETLGLAAVARVAWLDEDDLVFLASDSGGVPQLFGANLQSGGRPALTAAPAPGVTDFRAAPAGLQVAYTVGDELWLVHAAGTPGDALRLAAPGRAPVWAPDGRWLVYGAVELTEYELWAFDTMAVAGTPPTMIDGGIFGSDVTWSGDGARFAFDSPGGLFVVERTGVGFSAAERVGAATLEPGDAWSLDGRWLSATLAGAFVLLDFGVDPPAATMVGAVDRDGVSAGSGPFSADGRLAAWTAPDGLRLVDVRDPERTFLVSVKPPSRWAWAPSAAP